MASLSAFALLVLLGATETPAQATQSARIGVLVAGTDGLAAGAMQSRLESELRDGSADIALVPASELATALGKPKGALPANAAAQKLEAATLDAAVAAYYDGRIDAALKGLDGLERLQDARVGVSTGERRRLRLWRAAALLAKSDRIQAEVEVRSALAMDPDLQADLRVFPPSLREVVDAARTRGIPKVRITLEGLPKGATVYADERPVGATFNVPAGVHWVWATAKGFRAVETRIETDAEIAVPLALPLVLDGDALRAFAFDGAAPPADVALALEKARLDAVVVLADRGGTWTARVIRSSGSGDRGPVETAAPERIDALRGWAVAAARRAAADVVTARLAQLRSTWTVRVAVAAATVVDERRVTGDEGSAPPETSFTGAGPQLDVELARGIWLARAGGAWTTFALTSYQVRFPDGTVRLLDGGERTQAHVAIGGRWIFGPGDAEYWPTAGLLAGVRRTDHRADRIADSRGDLGLFPSHVRQAVEIRAIGGYPLRTRAGVLRADVEAAVAVTESLRESPRTSGAKPRSSNGLEADAAIRWLPASGAWEAALHYRVESGTDRFSGEATFPSDPPLRDARSERSTRTFLFQAGRRF